MENIHENNNSEKKIISRDIKFKPYPENNPFCVKVRSVHSLKSAIIAYISQYVPSYNYENRKYGLSKIKYFQQDHKANC